MADWQEVTAEESAALNKFLGSANEESANVAGLEDTGKSLPYIGWFWREVDFTRPLTLGHCGQFVGFIENNKWDYPEWCVTEEQRREIVTALRALKAEPTPERFQAVFDVVQAAERPGAARDARLQIEENERLVAEMHARWKVG